ncbi:hypothetical protein J4206_04725 [Candidatus Woesearchaeota archaeon]|nr:hypothetical protein [Candidatus Woesearchaeota archaeon]
MAFEKLKNLFGKRDPICGMKEAKGTGIYADSQWFCSEDCKQKYEDEQTI